MRLLMVVLFFVQGEVLRAAVVARLEWIPSPDANVAGYVLYQGVAGSDYLNGTDVGSQTSALLTNLHAGITNVLYVTAYDGEHVEGEPSNLIFTNFPGLYPPPTIGTIPTQLIGKNSSTGPLPLLIGDAMFNPAGLKLSASSSNPALVPDSNILLGGSDYDRTLTVVPTLDQVGSATITVTVDDGNARANTSFSVTVDAGVPFVPVYFPFEAEAGTLLGTMQPSPSPIATGGEFVSTARYSLGGATFAVDIPVEGVYVVWWRALARSTTAYPFIMVLDDGVEVFHATRVTWTDRWRWAGVTGSFRFKVSDTAAAPSSRTALPLVAGRHTITIWALDPDMLLDQVLITNDRTFVPAPPVLTVPAGATVDELVTLLLTNTATASNPSATQLTYSLTSAPNGMAIDPHTGVIRWTPTEEQGPGTYVIGVQVTDNGSPPLSEVSAFQVVVNEVNSPPIIESVPPQSIPAGSLFTFKIPAFDSDIPANVLTFSLDRNAPAGTYIDPSSGVFAWRPTLAQANNTYTLTVLVRDDGSPSLSSSGTFAITVTTPSIPIELTSTTFTNQEFHVRIRAVPGIVYSLEASTDFVSWTALTSQNATSAEFELVDSDEASYPYRFYRVVAQQQ